MPYALGEDERERVIAVILLASNGHRPCVRGLLALRRLNRGRKSTRQTIFLELMHPIATDRFVLKSVV
jgi:hypothetical protein